MPKKYRNKLKPKGINKNKIHFLYHWIDCFDIKKWIFDIKKGDWFLYIKKSILDIKKWIFYIKKSIFWYQELQNK